jgi:TatA/E family protein of Tat protein translocase
LPLLQLLRYDGLMSFADTVVLFVLALLLFGPKKLPGIARQIGKALNEFKRASNEFKAQIESEINQLEYQERQKERENREQEQKILPPSTPANAVESPRSTSQPESNQSQPLPPEESKTSAQNSVELAPVAASDEINSSTATHIPNA